MEDRPNNPTLPGAEALRSLEQTVLSAGHATAPRVSVVSLDDRQFVFKDYAATAGLFRRLVAPLLVWRETTALQRLADVDGIPCLIGRVGRRGLLMDYVPARPLPTAELSATTVPAVEAIVERMHAAGVVHADLRAARNVLVDDAGQPYIVDFVARLCRGPRWNAPWNWLFEQFRAADHSALAKLRVRYAPSQVRPEDHRNATAANGRERIARLIGAGTRQLVRRIAGRSD